MKATIEYNQAAWIITVPELGISFERPTLQAAWQFCREYDLQHEIIGE